MKYRVVESARFKGRYYVEYRIWFGWRRARDEYGCGVYFNTIEGALEFINRIIEIQERIKRSPIVVVEYEG